MLYLIEPTNFQLKWIDFPLSLAREAVDKYDADLGNLQWRDDSDKVATADVLAVALRHGIPCTRGIAIPAIHVIDLSRADEIRRITGEARKAHEDLAAQDTLLEHLMPGWKAQGDRLQANIDASMEESAQEAQRKAGELLAAPEQPELVAHWERLGGIV